MDNKIILGTGMKSLGVALGGMVTTLHKATNELKKINSLIEVYEVYERANAKKEVIELFGRETFNNMSLSRKVATVKFQFILGKLKRK